MIKARTKTGTIILGLSAENVKRLQAGDDMHFSLASIGVNEDIVITYGVDEHAILARLKVPEPLQLAQGRKLS